MFRANLLFLFIILLISNFTVYSQTEDWKQYSSSLAGLKINYPPDWTLNESKIGRAWQLRVLSPGVRDHDIWVHSIVNVCIQPIGNIPNPSNTRSGCRQHDDHLSDSYKDKVISEDTLKLNGLEIRKKTTTDRYGQSDNYIYAFFTAENKEFLISSYFPKRFDLNKYIPVFDQMLKTIQVLDERKTLTYRNDRYDFAITYPTSWKSCPVTKSSSTEEEILLLVPNEKLCNGGNYISVSRITEYSNEKNNRNLKNFLENKAFNKIISYTEFGNIHAAMGEISDNVYVRRERYFYTNYPQTYELLKISESFEVKQEIYQTEAKEILSSAQRFLRTTQ